jgi:hypothetical protein
MNKEEISRNKEGMRTTSAECRATSLSQRTARGASLLLLIIPYLSLPILIFISSLSFCAEKDDWLLLKSDHFFVYYKEPTQESYVHQIAEYAEKYYSTITERLGFRRFNFWLWDDRAKLYIYSTREEYLKDTRQPWWSDGNANVRKKIINTYYFEEGFFTEFLPHEMGHLIFREYIGYNTPLPLWIDEGIACIQQQDIEIYIKLAGHYVKDKLALPIVKLTRVSNKSMISPQLFYFQAASIMYFILDKYGTEKFVQWCRRLRDGESFQKALAYVYKIDNLNALDEAWLEWMQIRGLK